MVTGEAAAAAAEAAQVIFLGRGGTDCYNEGCIGNVDML